MLERTSYLIYWNISSRADPCSDAMHMATTTDPLTCSDEEVADEHVRADYGKIGIVCDGVRQDLLIHASFFFFRTTDARSEHTGITAEGDDS
jgi:hypothetical protein